MNDGYVKTDPWRLVEDRFDPSRALSSESLFALGNGVMGGRANFEERYSGETLQGNYIGGVYYPDKTRVGWWKNGYPEYFAKVPNAAFWIGVDVAVDGEPLDLATVAEVKSFYRETDMRRSVLTRRMRVVLKNGVEVAVETVRFLSLARRELGVVKYAVTPLNRAARITFSPYVDADVRNADANYDEKFWEEVSTEADATQSRTKKSGFEAAWAQAVELDGAEWHCETRPEKVRATAAVSREKGCAAVLNMRASARRSTTLRRTLSPRRAASRLRDRRRASRPCSKSRRPPGLPAGTAATSKSGATPGRSRASASASSCCCKPIPGWTPV